MFDNALYVPRVFDRCYVFVILILLLLLLFTLLIRLDDTFFFETGDASSQIDTQQQMIVYKCCAMGALLVCFLSLYGTMVLSMQYYLVTRALGHVSTVCIDVSSFSSANVFVFGMKKTRHLFESKN